MNTKQQKIKLILSVVSLLAFSSINPVQAHHGFDGRYDFSRPIYIEGIVRQTRWQSPHSSIIIELPKNLQIPNNLTKIREINSLGGLQFIRTLSIPKNILGTTQRVEFPPVGSMVQPLRNRLRSGDKMSVIVYRNCEAPNQLRVQFARLQDGTTIVRPGTVQTEVNGCNSRR